MHDDTADRPADPNTRPSVDHSARPPLHDRSGRPGRGWTFDIALWVLGVLAVVAPPARAQTAGAFNGSAVSARPFVDSAGGAPVLPASPGALPSPGGRSFDPTVPVVPSPGTAALLGGALLVAGARRRRG